MSVSQKCLISQPCARSFFYFQEAHKMVREANVKQAAAEKQLKEAQGKVPSHSFCLTLCSLQTLNTSVLSDWRPAGGGLCSENPGVDLYALLPEPPAPPSAAVAGLQSGLVSSRGPHAQQECQRCSTAANGAQPDGCSDEPGGQRGTNTLLRKTVGF